MTAIKQSGGLPERYKAHLSMATHCKKIIITIINNGVQGARCIRHKSAPFSSHRFLSRACLRDNLTNGKQSLKQVIVLEQ